jgi:RHS repeat-associated protein
LLTRWKLAVYNRRDVGGPSPATERYTQASKDFGGLLAQVSTANPSPRYYIADLARNIGVLANGSTISELHLPQAFGLALPGSTTPTTQPFGYQGDAGAYTDPTTGLVIMWNRIYDPNIGQFLNPDPIGIRGGDANYRRFVLNNPVRWVDPWGLIVMGFGTPSQSINSTGVISSSFTLPACPKGWDAGKGSVTACGIKNMGMTQMYCQHKPKCGQGTCCCSTLGADGLFVAILGSKLVCGATLQLMNRITGVTKTVRVIDEGPYANGADIDISKAVFGTPLAATWPVCIGPISQSTPPSGWSECQQGSACA